MNITVLLLLSPLVVLAGSEKGSSQVIPFLKSDSVIALSGTNNRSLPVTRRGLPSLGHITGSSVAFPKPGLYETKPYTCLVLVSEASVDDRAVKQPPKSNGSMPMVLPDFRLVPRGSK